MNENKNKTVYHVVIGSLIFILKLKCQIDYHGDENRLLRSQKLLIEVPRIV